MSLKALDELRKRVTKFGLIGSHDLLMFANAIEAEIAERYMELPVDADGVPVHVGDTLECHANGYDGVFDAFAVGDGCVIGNHPECELFNNPFKEIHVARYCHHAKPRTLEDVLREYAFKMNNAYNDPTIGGEDRADVLSMITDDYAAELRELMGGGE